MNYAGAEWLKKHRELSPFGETVANILGEVWQGIYYLNPGVLHKRCQWSHPSLIQVVIGAELSNYGSEKLLSLIVLCHANGIRLEISAANINYLRLSFAKSAWGTVPPIEQAIARIQERMGLEVTA